MKWVDNLRISSKLLIPMVAMALLFAGVVGMGAMELIHTATGYSGMTERSDPTVVRLVRVNKDAAQLGYDLYKSLTLTCLGADSETCRGLQRSMAASLEDGSRSLAEAERLDPDHLADYQGFEGKLKGVGEVATQAIALSMQDRNAEAMRAMSVADPQVRALAGELHAYNDTRLAQTKARSNALAASARRALWTMVLVGVAAIAGGLAAAIWIARTAVSRPLTRLAERMTILAGGDATVQIHGLDRRDEIGGMAHAVQVFKDNALKLRAAEAESAETHRAAEAERRQVEAARERASAELAQVVESLADGLARLSSGDLTYRIHVPFASQYEKLRTDFNAAMDSLREALATITAASEGLRGGAEEISTASDDMSRRTEQQAANLEESAAALDQITATVRRSAEGAKQASEIVTAARSDGERSGEVVTQAIGAMAQIEQSSSQITQIIGVIDEIAFQTNLLALNAGVEAARAGEVGRGFAVVAQEVRALAQRSAEAAKEIKGLIEASSTHVGRGVRLVRDTGEALRGIVSKVADIDRLVVDIAASAQEQSSGLNQVNAAVTQMDQVTQQNAAMVEEATAAAENLKGEAHKLATLVRRFRIGESAAPSERPPKSLNPVQRLQVRVASAIARA